MTKVRIDLRARMPETRRLREGNALLSQIRNNIVELDGSITYGEWLTVGSFPNYGDYTDKKPTLLDRLKGLFIRGIE